MKVILIFSAIAVFLVSCFTSAYEAKPGVPKDNQY